MQQQRWVLHESHALRSGSDIPAPVCFWLWLQAWQAVHETIGGLGQTSCRLPVWSTHGCTLQQCDDAVAEVGTRLQAHAHMDVVLLCGRAVKSAAKATKTRQGKARQYNSCASVSQPG